MFAELFQNPAQKKQTHPSPSWSLSAEDCMDTHIHIKLTGVCFERCTP